MKIIKTLLERHKELKDLTTGQYGQDIVIGECLDKLEHYYNDETISKEEESKPYEQPTD